MRDGTQLSANLILPTGSPPGSRFPTILIQTPYLATKEIGIGTEAAVLRQLISRGYAVALVNVRGTQWSEGEYHWLKGARDDGLDTLEWVTRQPCSLPSNTPAQNLATPGFAPTNLQS